MGFGEVLMQKVYIPNNLGIPLNDWFYIHVCHGQRPDLA